MRAAFLLWLVGAARVGAQVVETPVAFDSAARVYALTPAMVGRLDLRAPVWPVTGEFFEARLYSVSTGGTVLSVSRLGGRFERHSLSDDQVVALRAAIDAGLTAGSELNTRRRDTDAAIEARGAFARNQMILSAIAYGPLIASFANDGRSATGLYLASVGASFFVVNNLAKHTYVTRVQNGLATDGALRGYAATSGLVFAFSGDGLNRKVYSANGLAGAIGGAKIGFEYGRRLTDSEAHAARTASSSDYLNAFSPVIA